MLVARDLLALWSHIVAFDSFFGIVHDPVENGGTPLSGFESSSMHAIRETSDPDLWKVASQRMLSTFAWLVQSMRLW